MPVVESLPALVVVVLLDKMWYSCCCCCCCLSLSAVNNTQRGTQKKVEKGLLFFFDETFLSVSPFLVLPHFTSRNVRINALLLQKRVVVCLLSLSSFSFIATTARGVKI